MELEKLKEWIGQRGTIHAPLCVGDEVRRESVIKDVTIKQGRTGQTLLVFELARTHATTPLTFTSSRNVRPLFVNRPFQVCGEPSPDNKTAKMWVVDQDGAPTLIADAEFK